MVQCNRNARDNRAGHLFPVGMTPNTFSLFSFQKCQFYFTLNVIVVFGKYLFWTTQFIRLQPVVTRSNHKWSISIYIQQNGTQVWLKYQHPNSPKLSLNFVPQSMYAWTAAKMFFERKMSNSMIRPSCRKLNGFKHIAHTGYIRHTPTHPSHTHIFIGFNNIAAWLISIAQKVWLAESIGTSVST